MPEQNCRFAVCCVLCAVCRCAGAVDTANRLLQACGSTRTVRDFRDCTPAFFVALVERMFGTKFDPTVQLASRELDQALQSDARTCQVAIEFLAVRRACLFVGLLGCWG